MLLSSEENMSRPSAGGRRRRGREGARLILVLAAEIQRLGNLSSVTTGRASLPFMLLSIKHSQDKKKNLSPLYSPWLVFLWPNCDKPLISTL